MLQTSVSQVTVTLPQSSLLWANKPGLGNNIFSLFLAQSEKDSRTEPTYPVKASHIIMRQSGPSSAVAIHRLSSLTQRQEMMLGWPCGNEEHVLKNDKDRSPCGPQEGLGPRIPELLLKLACLESASTLLQAHTEVPHLLLGGGAVDSQAVSSSTNLKKLRSSQGVEVSTQPNQDL